MSETLTTEEKVNHVKCMAENEDVCICLICNEAFFAEEGLQAHLLNHSGWSFAIIPLSLEACEDGKDLYEFHFPDEVESPDNSEINLTPSIPAAHTFRKPRSTDSSKFRQVHVCSTCGKEFKRKDHLKKHVAVHSGIKPFTCLICDKSFSRKDRLKEHCVIHLSNGWSCYFCGKMFAQRCILRKHEMIHRGVKPFVCELCDTRFSRKNDLLRHATSHTGEKSHFCEICGKGFTQKRLVNRHLHVHKKNNSKLVKRTLINQI